MIVAAETASTSIWLATMADTAVAASMYWRSTVSPYLSKAPIALAIHRAANEPTGEAYETVNFGSVPASVRPLAQR